jgi:hypothetical protein
MKKIIWETCGVKIKKKTEKTKTTIRKYFFAGAYKY